MKEQIRNIAVSGADTEEKYNIVCEIVNHNKIGQEWLRGYEGDERIGHLYDNGLEDNVWLDYWREDLDNFNNCKKYTYEEFISKHHLED